MVEGAEILRGTCYVCGQPAQWDCPLDVVPAVIVDRQTRVPVAASGPVPERVARENICEVCVPLIEAQAVKLGRKGPLWPLYATWKAAQRGRG